MVTKKVPLVPCSSPQHGRDDDVEIKGGGSSSSGGLARGDIASCSRNFAEASFEVFSGGSLGEGVVGCDEARRGSTANQSDIRGCKGDVSAAGSETSSYDVYSGGAFVPEEDCIVTDSGHNGLDDEGSMLRTLSSVEDATGGDDWCQEGGVEIFASTIVETGRDDSIIIASAQQ